MERVGGVDAARGLAVLGMFAAHVGAAPAAGRTDWLAVADGRSSALFAVLAGISIGLLSGGPVPVAGPAQRAVRRRILARAGAVAVIGYGLVALGTPIAVILPAYALMWVLVLPTLGWGRRRLLAGAAAFALVGPLVVSLARETPTVGAGPVALLVTGYYPAVVWLAYILAGLAVGRSDLHSRTVAWRLLAGGAGLALLGYGGGALLARAAPSLAGILSIAPRADTTPEVIGNLGVALAVLGSFLLIGRTSAGRLSLGPLMAVGTLALTVYSVQVVVIALAGPVTVWEQRTNGTLLAFVLATLALTTAWVRWFGRGPLEAGVRRISMAAARGGG